MTMRVLARLTLLISIVAGAPVRADDSFTHAGASFEKDDDSVVIAVAGLGETVLKACAELDAKSAKWQNGARVQMAGGSATALAERPAMLGKWSVNGRRLCFAPRFPLLPGTSVRITIDPPLLIDPKNGKSNPLVFDLQTPMRDLTPATKVEHIYPTRKVLPENQLRFYIHFSKPMSQGEAYEHVELLDAKGKPIDDVFLELGEELWDPTMTRFTLLFHPGRVKSGLQPREELGPILEAGKSYTLVVGGKWRDAEGRPLIDKEYRKSFTAGQADNEPPDPKKWKIVAPAAGHRDAVRLRFNKSMDHALLNRVLWIEDSNGKTIRGKVSVAEEETLWKFVPEQPWRLGKYHLVAETILEDLAANRIGRPFEVNMLRPIPKADEKKTVELPFEVEK